MSKRGLSLSEETRARIDKPLARKITSAAKREQISESQIVRRALRDYFARQEESAA